MRFRQLLILRTSHVVISIETERVVNEIHDRKEELRSSNALRTAERPTASRKLVRALLAILLVILCLRTRSSLQVNENGLRLMLTLHQGAVSLQRYPRWSRRWYLIDDQYEREEARSYHWDKGNSKIISDKYWIHLIHKAAIKPESNTAWITRNPDFIFELFRDTLVVFQ